MGIAEPAAPPESRTGRVEMHGVEKRFGRTVALAGVDFDLEENEIHALLGENGAGKTTLMNVLYGLIRPDAGSISIGGSPIRPRNPEDAIEAGVGMVHQHFKLVPTLTVAENMVLGERGGPMLSRRRLASISAQLSELGERYGLEVDPRARVWQLSVGEQQRVEILRALYRKAKILILDEPTATLTPIEIERMFPKLRLLADEGASIVFITHHLEEVVRWADRITVLRHGERVGTLAPRETTTPELARMMVGRDVTLMRVVAGERILADDDEGAPAAGKPATDGGIREVLAVDGLNARGDRGVPALRDLSFSVAAGEILAIAGVEGNGQPELEEALFGLRHAKAGTVELEGRDLTRAEPDERLRAGLALVPSDRYRRGVIRDLTVAENLVLDRIGDPPFSTRRGIDRSAVSEHARALISKYSIQVSGPEQRAGTLSGGNAQRLVLARTLSRELRCLIAAQPTRGLDVGAIEFVWEQLAAARDRGVAIVLISTDLDEVISLADRCSVIYRGRFVASWAREELDHEQLGLAMGGAANGAANRDRERARTEEVG
ncbi:MAG TPA: ABC transporter ATP-binding protein [Solirubrobacterales bacterium]|nr:ABC transporter ATP-binding protein [Solirubrobacterales bacterium]